MNKTKTGLILVMSVLVMCILAVPAIAKNVTDAECGGCFGAMPPEITAVPGSKEVSMASEGAGATVIWEDDFSTDPFSIAVMVSASGWQQSQMGGMNARNCREEVGGYIEQKVVG